MRPGDRVTDGTRIGTVEALRPGSSVDVRFDGASFIQRCGVASLKPVRGNPGPRGGLTPREREALPDSVFALPGRRFPINDANHGRIALQYILAGRVAERDVNTVVQAVLQRWGQDREVRAFYEKHKAKLTRANVAQVHGRRAAANPREEVYDPAKEQFRSVVQGVYESLVRKELGLPYKTPFVQNPKGRRLDAALGEATKRRLLSSAYGIATRQGQKHGWLEFGTQTPTAKGRRRSEERLLDPSQRRHAEENRSDYERTLAAVRKSGHFRVVAEVVDGQKRYVVQPRPPAELVSIPEYRLSEDKALEDAKKAESAFRQAPKALKARTNPYYLTARFADEVDVEDEPDHIILNDGKPDTLRSAAVRLGVEPNILLRYGILERPDGEGGWEEMVPLSLPRMMGVNVKGAPRGMWQLPGNTPLSQKLTGHRVRKDLLIKQLEDSPEMQHAGKYPSLEVREASMADFKAADIARRRAEEEEAKKRHKQTQEMYGLDRPPQTYRSALNYTEEERKKREAEGSKVPGAAVVATPRAALFEILTPDLVGQLSLQDAKDTLRKIESDPLWKRYATAQASADAQSGGSSEAADAARARLQEGLIEMHAALVRFIANWERSRQGWAALPAALQPVKARLKPGNVVISFASTDTVRPWVWFVSTAMKQATQNSLGEIGVKLLEVVDGLPENAWRSYIVFAGNPEAASKTIADRIAAASDEDAKAYRKLLKVLNSQVEKDADLREELREKAAQGKYVPKTYGPAMPSSLSAFDIARDMAQQTASETATGAYSVASEAQQQSARKAALQRRIAEAGGQLSKEQLAKFVAEAEAEVKAALGAKGLFTDVASARTAQLKHLLMTDPDELAERFVLPLAPARTKEQLAQSIKNFLGLQDKKERELAVETKSKKKPGEDIRSDAFWDVEFKAKMTWSDAAAQFVPTGEVETRYVMYVRKKLTGISRLERLAGAVVFVESTKPVKLRGKAPNRGPDTKLVDPDTYRMEERNLAEARRTMDQGQQQNNLGLTVRGRMMARKAMRNINHYRSALLGYVDPYEREEYKEIRSDDKIGLFNNLANASVEAQRALEEAAATPFAGRAAASAEAALLLEQGRGLRTPQDSWVEDKSFRGEMAGTRSFDTASGRMFSADDRIKYKKYYTTNPVLAYYTIHLWNTPEFFTGTAINLAAGVPIYIDAKGEMQGPQLVAVEVAPVTVDNPEHDPFKVYKDLLASEVYLRGLYLIYLLRGDLESAGKMFVQLFGQSSETLAGGESSIEITGLNTAIQKIAKNIELIPSARDLFGVWGYERDMHEITAAAAQARMMANMRLRNGMITQAQHNAEVEDIAANERLMLNRSRFQNMQETALGKMFASSMFGALAGTAGRSPRIEEALVAISNALWVTIQQKEAEIQQLAAQSGGMKALPEYLQQQEEFLQDVRRRILSVG